MNNGGCSFNVHSWAGGIDSPGEPNLSGLQVKKQTNKNLKDVKNLQLLDNGGWNDSKRLNARTVALHTGECRLESCMAAGLAVRWALATSLEH